MKILLADGLDEKGQEILRRFAAVDDQAGIDADSLMDIIPAYDAVIVRGRTGMPRDLIERAGRLRVIGLAGIGVETIDLAAAQARHITVVNAPVATAVAVAEHTFALMLALLRQIPKADNGMKSGRWMKKTLTGTELFGKTLGIIGMGRIGTAVCERAGAFGVTLLGYDPALPEDEIARCGAEPVTLDSLLTRSDVITIHSTLTPQTKMMIDSQAIGQMKRGVWIVHTARGGILDETALLAGLESGQVAGAALDVYQEEPPGLTALVSHTRVIATPHIGAQTEEAQVRTACDIADEVRAALTGEALRWKIV